MLPRDRADRLHVRALSVKMHRYDAHSARRDSRFDLRRIDVIGRPIGIHEHRFAARDPDRFSRRKEGVRVRARLLTSHKI